MASFADVQYCIYAEIVGGLVRKIPELYGRNIWMVSKGPFMYYVSTFVGGELGKCLF